MDPIKVGRNDPERQIQNDVIRFLEARMWFVLATHGNMYQYGFPDLYGAHLQYGTRWVEIKNPEHYSFTRAQRDIFPKLAAKGVGIWILTAATEYEYAKLFQKPNWHYFLGKSKV